MTQVPLPPTQRSKALAVLREAIRTGEVLKLEEVALRSGSSLKTAHLARQELLASGELGVHQLPASGRHPRPPGTGGGLRGPKPDDIMQAVLNGTAVTLSTEQQRAILSGLILHSPDHTIKVQAQNALTRLDAQAGTSLAAGPGIPLTEEARIERLSRLLTACGWLTVRKAVKVAFGRELGTEVKVDPEPCVANLIGSEMVKNVPGSEETLS